MYSRLGMLAAMSLIHGGGAFRLFGPTVFNFLCGMNPADLIAGISEVPDPSLREILKQVSLKGHLQYYYYDSTLSVHSSG